MVLNERDNQGIRLVGSAGLIEVDAQASAAYAPARDRAGMRTYNPAFFQETMAPGGGTVYRGYGLDSIAHFVDNVAYLKDGGSLGGLAGVVPRRRRRVGRHPRRRRGAREPGPSLRLGQPIPVTATPGG